ncbi:hypothetical protein Dimus_008059, partial [Dionaea muscipula]
MPASSERRLAAYTKLRRCPHDVTGCVSRWQALPQAARAKERWPHGGYCPQGLIGRTPMQLLAMACWSPK